MRGAKLPLPQYVFMAWCSVKAQGHYLYLYVYLTGTFTALALLGAVLLSRVPKTKNILKSVLF